MSTGENERFRPVDVMPYHANQDRAAYLRESTPFVLEVRRPAAILFLHDRFDAWAGYIAAALEIGWRASFVTNVEEAWRRIERAAHDALVVWVSSQTLSFVRHLKHDPSTCHIPVVALADSRALTWQAQLAELFRVLALPCEPRALVETLSEAVAIADLLAARRARRQLGQLG
ncbi:MAG: hypothetical protein ACLQVI_04190 [Polyangiaceae bacterium]